MDDEWQDTLVGLGHSVSVQSASYLNSPGNLENVDILIWSSGVMSISSTQWGTIDSFVAGGGGAYLQGEYQTTYSTNQAFASILGNAGISFTWTGTVSGQLSPVTIAGCWDEQPRAVSPLSYYWYGATGTVSHADVDVLLTGNGQPVGWTWCDPGPGGLLVHNTDQDWVRGSDSNANARTFMQNIADALANPQVCR